MNAVSYSLTRRPLPPLGNETIGQELLNEFFLNRYL